MSERRMKVFASIFIFLTAWLLLATDGTGQTAVWAAPGRQSLTGIVSAEGKVEPTEQIEMSFQVGGAITEIFVAEGDNVQAGDPLVRLDSAAAELRLARAVAGLSTAESSLAAAESRRALAERAGQTALAQLTVAEATLALTQAGPLAEQITAAENRVAAAEAAVNQAVGVRDATLAGAEASEILAAQAAVAAAQADVQQLVQAYEDILNSCFDTPDGEVCPLFGPVEEQTRRQLEAARLQQEASQAALDALQDGATPAQEQAANARVEVARANLAIAQAHLALLLEPVSQEQLQLAEVAVMQAQVGIQQAEVTMAQAEAVLAQAEAAVLLAEADVAAAELMLERTILKAAFAGTVVSVMVNEGELIAPGFPIVTVADLSHWQVETVDLTELDIALIEKGAGVQVRVDALPDTVAEGVVTAVSLFPRLASGDVVYTVTISLPDVRDLPLRWGMTAFVDIDVE